VRFQIQEKSAADWNLVADTSLPAPGDFIQPAERKSLPSLEYVVGGRSVVVFVHARGPLANH
jgi:hypothetical protein